MFGFGFGEILLIVVVAIIFLGPDKLPKAIVDIAKFIKAVKKTIDGAKDTIDKELNISELKKEALEYKEKFEQQVQSIEKKTVSPIMQEYGNIDSMFSEYNPKKILQNQVDGVKESIDGLDAKKSSEENLDTLEELATSTNTKTVHETKNISSAAQSAVQRSGLDESLVLNQLNNDLSVGEVNNIHSDITAAQAGKLNLNDTNTKQAQTSTAKKARTKQEPISKEEREKRHQAKLAQDAKRLELRAKEAKFKTNDLDSEGKQARRQKKIQKKIEKSAK
ncbi:twin arginine-targeting protein translocase TatB [Helicobacter sp. 13S00401-1]|nr:Sec-independent protein translocase protein TatB [Helicobacter sp. 13S00401-1]PAF51421.1 twin arginine-targeting protein translocase TatB [Helicobacter sp. 13S00401-1]